MYILTSKYFPLDYWPDLYFPALPDVAVDIQYTEVMEFAVCIATSAEFDVIMPNDEIESAPDMTIMVVAGAGSAFVNETCTYKKVIDGKPYYASNYVDVSRITIKWVTSTLTWVIAMEDFFGGFTSFYQSYEDVATPNLCTAWQVTNGTLPVPTVTAGTGFALGEVAAFTVEMPMIIDFELYEELSA